MTKDEEFFQWAKAFDPKFKTNELDRWMNQSLISGTTISLLQSAMKNPHRPDWTAMLVVSDSVLEDGLVTAYEGMRRCVKSKIFPNWWQYVDREPTGAFFNHAITWIDPNIYHTTLPREGVLVSAGQLSKCDLDNLVGCQLQKPLYRLHLLEYMSLGVIIGSRPINDERKIDLLKRSSYYGAIMAFHDAGVILETLYG